MATARFARPWRRSISISPPPDCPLTIPSRSRRISPPPAECSSTSYRRALESRRHARSPCRVGTESRAQQHPVIDALVTRPWTPRPAHGNALEHSPGTRPVPGDPLHRFEDRASTALRVRHRCCFRSFDQSRCAAWPLAPVASRANPNATAKESRWFMASPPLFQS